MRAVPVEAVAAIGELQVVDLGPADARGVGVLGAVKDRECAEHDALVGDGADVVKLGAKPEKWIGPVKPVGARPADGLIGIPARGLQEVGALEIQAGAAIPA